MIPASTSSAVSAAGAAGAASAARAVRTGVEAGGRRAHAAGVRHGGAREGAARGHGVHQRARHVAQPQRHHLLRGVHAPARACNTLSLTPCLADRLPGAARPATYRMP